MATKKQIYIKNKTGRTRRNFNIPGAPVIPVGGWFGPFDYPTDQQLINGLDSDIRDRMYEVSSEDPNASVATPPIVDSSSEVAPPEEAPAAPQEPVEVVPPPVEESEAFDEGEAVQPEEPVEINVPASVEETPAPKKKRATRKKYTRKRAKKKTTDGED
jgi:hypothetical protein